MQKITKKLYEVVGKYNIYLVNAEQVRNSSLDNEEFGGYAIHKWFPNLIPVNEIWIDEKLNNEERHISTHVALLQNTQIEKGISQHKAYLNGLKAEKSEREKLDHKQLHKKHVEQTHDTVPDDVYIKVYTFIPGFTVWIVNGQFVRDLYKTDFIEGGNPKPGVYCFVPKGEIWIDNAVAKDEMPYMLIHEYTEYILMTKKGMPYDKAHKLASKVEFHWRNKHTDLNNIKDQLSPEWALEQVKTTR